MVLRATARLRCDCETEEPRALANGRDCRLGTGFGRGFLGDDAQHAAFSAVSAARPVRGLLQTLLMRRVGRRPSGLLRELRMIEDSLVPRRIIRAAAEGSLGVAAPPSG